jgi:hypothetical protein
VGEENITNNLMGILSAAFAKVKIVGGWTTV